MPMVILILFLVITFFVASLPFWLFDTESRFHAGAVSWQGLAAMLIALVAGYWYLVERRGTAHANVGISATGVRLDERTALIQARIVIENSGQILLAPQMLDVRLLSVVPHHGLSPAALARHSAADPAAWPGEVGDAPAYAGSEVRWSGLRQFRAPSSQEIEPGERDVRVIDMIVPCDIRVAKLTVQVRKPSPQWWQWWLLEPEAGWWWKDRTLLDLRRLCGGAIGTVRTLGPIPLDDG